MQRLLQSIHDGAKTGADACRLFHGRGQTYPGLEFVSIDWFSPVLLISLYKEPDTEWLEHFHNAISQLEYGYLWWSGVSGSHRFNFAWGHGGQMICVIQDLDMVIVTAATGLGGQFGQDAWRQESEVLELAGRLIALL